MMLNKFQNKAIHIIDNPCLILAGAGSGKTSVIINKVITLITIYQYDPKKIFAITFTNKAAKEIKYRLCKKLTVKQIKDITVSTFHALGLKIIRSEYKILGLKKNFTLFDEDEQLRLLKSLTDANIKNDVFFLKKLLYQISNWKNNLLTPKLAHEKINSSLEKTYVLLYEKYDLFLKQHNILDFSDLIFLPTMLLQNNTYIKLNWQKKVQYLLVDEYQDINISQYQLMKLLCGHNSNLTVVGDNDQSIYSWRGAQQKIFYLLKQDFPSLDLIKLEQNYRSSGCILHAANILISNNINFFNKKLFSTLDYGNKIFVFMFINEIHEAQQIIRYIQKHKSNYKNKYNDYAILYRSNYQVKVVESELIYRNIPYIVHAGHSFFSSLEIKDLLAYLRLIVNHTDDLAFLRIINVPRRKIGLITLSKLKIFAKKNQISLFAASTDKRMIVQLNATVVLKLNNFIVWILHLSSFLSNKPENILNYIINDVNYFDWVINYYNNVALSEKRIQDIVFFSQWLHKTLVGNSTTIPLKLEDVLIHFLCGDFERLDADHTNLEHDKLHLMTIHASKGLEFSVVCIIGMEEGTFPHQKSIIDNNITEERRLMYVGMTRAKTQLLLSFCKNKKRFGIFSNLQPSRFLFELPKKEIYWVNYHMNYNKKLCNKNYIISDLK
ncbi:ATP-dependent DNA helicase Rep [Buchnera aphidicola (Cinara splendens)]|uniref:DNA 3'-5' helicase n=1 Tax=Buchnera aphidicola (Cinara splendens) TaxID=2518979 RepID=A0A451DEW9_9GAMM|nr:UvrD-helicase domain-containing protein [Buchnera aphidicola]VFP85136.1 ATP-dependent DNA helicase Rep [Buchnera aphidicola (Cinara splendens)]